MNLKRTKTDLIQLPHWTLRVLLLGVVLDLGLSAALIYQDVQLQSNTKAAHCWFKVLDQAVIARTPAARAKLQTDAQICVRYIP